ncbi:TPA: AzlD domain-containing protein [Bacillus pseudomycoides]|nr:AzlD domain-containing protein [Bacillus pseudomycoides]
MLLVSICIMVLLTYVTRFPMLLLSSRISFPKWVERGLKVVPIGIFASLTIPLVLFHEKGGLWSPEYIVAGIVAFGVGVWKRQVVFSLLTGVITLVCWRIFVGW